MVQKVPMTHTLDHFEDFFSGNYRFWMILDDFGLSWMILDDFRSWQ